MSDYECDHCDNFDPGTRHCKNRINCPYDEEDAEDEDAGQNDGDGGDVREIDKFGEEAVAEVDQGAEHQNGNKAAPHALYEALEEEGTAYKTTGGANQQHASDIETLSVNIQTDGVGNQQHRDEHEDKADAEDDQLNGYEVVMNRLDDKVGILHILHDVVLFDAFGNRFQRVGVGIFGTHAHDDGGVDRVGDDLGVVVADSLDGLAGIVGARGDTRCRNERFQLQFL